MNNHIIRKIKKNPYLYIIMLIAVILIGAFRLDLFGSEDIKTSSRTLGEQGTLSKKDDDLLIRFLDVGQGDSTLIYLPGGEIMLIDCSKNIMEEPLSDYLYDIGIDKIDYLIGTHMDEDHIGGMDAVVENFDIENIYLPLVPDDMTPTTSTYLDLLTAIDNKGYAVDFIDAERTLIENDNIKVDFISPSKGAEYSSMNDYSIVTMISYNSRRFLIMGDAESAVEYDLIDSYYDLSADVLKCGHHGSSHSSKMKFLKEVSPAYAVISCGEGNSYGHPHVETMDRLNKIGAEVYRTDTQQTIQMLCEADGSIGFETHLDSVEG